MASTCVNRGSRRHGGLTLIEVMIALGILATGLLSLAAMQLHAMRGGNQGRHATQAAAIAQSRMEALQQLTWANMAPTGGWAAAVTVTNDVQAPSAATEQSYLVDWRIADVAAGWTRNIDVRVRWDDPRRPNRAYTISSMRFNREAL